MREDQQPQAVIQTMEYNPGEVVVTDPAGNPLPENHPAVQQPQVGRPHSKGDLTLPENAELAEALMSQDRRTVRRGAPVEEEAAAPATPAMRVTTPVNAVRAETPTTPNAPVVSAPVSSIPPASQPEPPHPGTPPVAP